MRDILSLSDISITDEPAAFMAMMSAFWLRAVGARPLYFFSALALAIPSRCRSSMISRSHVATPARMVSMSLLVGLRVF